MTQENNTDLKANEPGAALPEVQNELSKVASNPKQSIFIVVIICGIFIYIFFNLFINNKSSNDIPAPLPSGIAKPVQEIENPPLSIPTLPPPPALETPIVTLPPPPPPPVELPVIPAAPLPPLQVIEKPALPVTAELPAKLVDNDEEKRRREAKRKSSIVLLGGTEAQKTAEQVEQEVTFKDRGNMEFVLARGKIITAVVETAINTDFGGEVKAIINRDVYSEKEKVILIPKGSKVFGSYSNGAEASGRISIIWTRIDLSNGYVINLQGTTTDDLGRAGAQGRVDNKFKERIANAVLISAFNIGFAQALDKVITPPVSSQAAATNTAQATNIQNLALQIFQDKSTTSSEDIKIQQICSGVTNALTDKTTAAYTSISQACVAAQTTTGAATGQRISILMTAVNSAAASLLSTTATATTPTQAQNASKQAFTDVSNTVKEMLTQQFKPTVTIDQGTTVKIYVNKDYKFPKNVLQKSRLMQ